MFDKQKHKTLIGDNIAYVEKNVGKVIVYQNQKTPISKEELLFNITTASVDLSSYENTFQGKSHIERNETKDLFNWIVSELKEDKPKIALLVGNAGYGKSVVLKDLFDLLKNKDIPALGIKADKILNISSVKDFEEELNLKYDIFSIFQIISKDEKCVFIVDQIDALSLSLSSNRHAINAYGRLIKQLEVLPNVRIIISCRTYDLEYDSDLGKYKKGKTVKLPLLDAEQVNQVLSNFQIEVAEQNQRLKEFLRIPLHLNLFCKIGIAEQFDDTISLQKLYDEIWIEYIEKSNSINSEKIIGTLTLIAQTMNERQQIVVDKRLFDAHGEEINYLLHHDLLKTSSSNNMQFLHQTFFDYVYARTFITSGKIVTDWLQKIHQGLFIRSQVKQIFAYLRDLDPATYLSELKKLLQGKEYRFHLKLLLITDLGFYNNPSIQEKRFVLDFIIKDTLFFQIFLESTQTIEWFTFIISQKGFQRLLCKNENKTDWMVISLCARVVDQSPQAVIDFLSKYKDKNNIIENVLLQIPESDIHQTYNLYQNSVSKWNTHTKCSYLEKVLSSDPDFVISELKKEFDKNISNVSYLDRDFIPGGYDAFVLYHDLFEKYPNKAIPYFLYVVEKMIETTLSESISGLYGDFAFDHYRPESNNKDINEPNNIYDVVLYSIKNDLLDDASKRMILSLLDSIYANLVAVTVFYLWQNVKTEYKRAFELFINKDFFRKIKSSEILQFYAKSLLSATYPLLSEDEQKALNQAILSTLCSFHHWTYEVDYSKNKVRSDYLQNTYELISMIPHNLIGKYKDLKGIYQEGRRKYATVKNIPPQTVSMTSGEKTYGNDAYEKMSFNDWEKTFLKLNMEQRSIDEWNKPTKEGNKYKFEEFVAKEPEKYYPFIINCVNKRQIDIDYLLSGLEGLKNGNYCKKEFEKLCLDVIEKRASELNETNLRSFLWSLRYVVKNNKDLDKRVFDFLKQIIYTYPDKEFTPRIIQQKNKGMDVITAGINSIRGTAVDLLVGCYALSQCEKELFETLEYVADTANEITRSCVIYKGAWLNILNKNRALDLYLKLLWDYNQYLLSIPYHDGHPLFYHIHVDFRKLIPFFSKAITIEDAGKSMAIFLFNAYLHNKPKAYSLLKNLICLNTEARQELAWNISVHILKDEKHSNKGWKIMNLLLAFDDKELGEKVNNCFLHIPTQLNNELICFLNKYIKSPIGNYKGDYFYVFLRKIISSDSNRVLKWFFASNPEAFKRDFYNETPITVLIESYNGARKYEKDNPLLEKAMDMFDSLLKLQEYRNVHMRKFMKELSS